jgi:hypothetical protein
MKLRLIAEEISGSPTVVRDTAKALESLIQYIYALDPQSAERLTFDGFLDKPTANNWAKSKWVIDSLIKQAAQTGEDTSGLEDLGDLKEVSSPVVAASVYDLDPSAVRGTPLQDVALTQKKRDDLKAAIGPQGYVSALSEIGDLRDADIKDLLKDTAQNKDKLEKAADDDLPKTRKIEEF